MSLGPSLIHTHKYIRVHLEQYISYQKLESVAICSSGTDKRSLGKQEKDCLIWRKSWAKFLQNRSIGEIQETENTTEQGAFISSWVSRVCISQITQKKSVVQRCFVKPVAVSSSSWFLSYTFNKPNPSRLELINEHTTYYLPLEIPLHFSNGYQCLEMCSCMKNSMLTVLDSFVVSWASF